MATDRAFDIVVFGATGYTGQFVVSALDAENLARGTRTIKYAVSGRSQGKLEQLFPGKSILVADTQDEERLISAFSQCRLVINVTGPYRFHGAAVMRACLRAGTHYVDVCGEPAFLESASVEFDSQFRSANLAAIGSCGYDSIPADLGVAFTAGLFQSPKLISLISAYHIVYNNPGINATTYESAVHGVRNAAELGAIRKKEPSYSVKLNYPGGRRKMPKLPQRLEGSRFAFPFAGADGAIIRRTQAQLVLREEATPVQAHVYGTVEGVVSMCFTMLFFLVLIVLTRTSFGTDLLLAYPSFFSAGVFTKTGPIKEDLDKATFDMRFVAEGWNSAGEVGGSPTRKVVARFAGNEAFYRFTALGALQSALCVLEEREAVPAGVSTPYIALRKTTIYERLRRHGVRIEVVSDTSV